MLIQADCGGLSQIEEVRKVQSSPLLLNNAALKKGGTVSGTVPKPKMEANLLTAAMTA